mgnify:CR=1 FL=1
MAEPILLDRYRDNTYAQTQAINDKLDFVIAEMRDIKQEMRDMKNDIRTLDAKIDKTRTELKDEIDKNRAELKEEISSVRSELNTARWQIFGVVVAQICSIGAIVWAIVSALK